MSIFLFLRRALFAMPFHLSPLSPIAASCLGAEARAHFISRGEGAFQEVGVGSPSAHWHLPSVAFGGIQFSSSAAAAAAAFAALACWHERDVCPFLKQNWQVTARFSLFFWAFSRADWK